MFLMPGSRARAKKLPGSAGNFSWNSSQDTLTINSVAGGTGVVTTQPILNLTQTWNGSGVVFAGIQLNVTNTASNVNSLLLDLQVGGVSQFNVASNGAITSVSQFVVGATGVIGWSTRGYLFARSDGVFLLVNNAQNDFGRLEFGGETTSFPALKRSGATIAVRLADDSGDADIQARTVRGNSVAFANRPGTPTAGMMLAITDGSVATWGTTISAGGGANPVLIFYNGTAWTVAGK